MVTGRGFLRPWDPIFYHETNYGALNAVLGNTPPSTLPLHVIGEVSFPSSMENTYAMVLDGSTLYAALVLTPSQNFVSVDVSDPTAPVVLDQITLSVFQAFYSFVVDGGYAYPSSTVSGMQPVDISNPAAMSAGSVVSDADGRQGVKHPSADIIYTADSDSASPGINVIDISTPGTPVYLSTYSTQTFDAVAFANGYLFALDNNTGIRELVSIDVSTPTAPAAEDSIGPFSERPDGFMIFGNTAYVVLNDGWLVTIDVTDPTNLVTLQTIQLNATADLSQQVAVMNNKLYVSTVDSGLGVTVIYIYDVTDPSDVTYETMFHDTALDGGQLYPMITDGTYLYVGAYEPSPNKLVILGY
jgi:hypothetical protein